jgi:WD40 repeat protein
MRADTAEALGVDQPGPGQSFPYDAFISYDHDDRPVAHGIQRSLHRIGRRVGQLRALRVFRDSTDLSARHQDTVFMAAVSPDRHRIVTGVLDDTIRIWDLDIVPTMTEHDTVGTVAISPDGKRILSAANRAQLRDANTGHPLGAPMQVGVERRG